MANKLCAYCRKPFFDRYNQGKMYCSNKCKDRAFNGIPLAPEFKLCEMCGRISIPRRCKYCSDCRKESDRISRLKYSKSNKFKDAVSRYQKTQKGKDAYSKAYNTWASTDEGKAYFKAYNNSQAHRDASNKYNKKQREKHTAPLHKQELILYNRKNDMKFKKIDTEVIKEQNVE